VNDDDMIQKLILAGGLEAAGIDSDSGEMLYSFTHKIKTIMPELYHEHMNHVNKEMMALWEGGFVDMNLLLDEPIVTLTPKAFDSSETSKLSKDTQWSLEEMKRLLKRREL